MERVAPLLIKLSLFHSLDYFFTVFRPNTFVMLKLISDMLIEHLSCCKIMDYI